MTFTCNGKFSFWKTCKSKPCNFPPPFFHLPPHLPSHSCRQRHLLVNNQTLPFSKYYITATTPYISPFPFHSNKNISIQSSLSLSLVIPWSSAMLMLVNCSNCHTPLQLPPGAQSIRCVLCQAVTIITDPRSIPPPSASSSHHHHYNHYHYQQPPPQLQALSPYNLVPSGPPPQVHGRKRAVICGVSYKKTRFELKGCINDANCMKYLLVNRFKFPESSIITLTGKNFSVSF